MDNFQELGHQEEQHQNFYLQEISAATEEKASDTRNRKPKRMNHSKIFQLTLPDMEKIEQDHLPKAHLFKIYLDKKVLGNEFENSEKGDQILSSESNTSSCFEMINDKDSEIRRNLLILRDTNNASSFKDDMLRTTAFFAGEKSLLTESGRILLTTHLPKVVEFMENDETHKVLGLHLSWHQKYGLYLNMQPISADFLVYYLLEETMHLFRDHAISIAAQNGENSSYFFSIIEYLARRQIQSLLKQKTLNRLAHLKACRKTGQHMAKDIKTLFESVLLDLLAFGLCKCFIKKKDLHFLMLQQPGSFFFLKELFSRDKYLKLEQQIKTFPSIPYLPWIIVIKRSLLQFTTTHKEFLAQNEDLTRRCLTSVIKWLNLPSKRALITWLFQFFFRDSSYSESKRQFLFIQGDTDLGKTAFIQLLLADPNFLTEFLTTQYFSSYKQGEFDLHCLIFDDPTPLSSSGIGGGGGDRKNQLLDPEFFLNLSRYDKTKSQNQHSINVKNGYMLINKGQVCLISNQHEEKLFSKKYLPIMRTRLLKMTFSTQTPFPLQFQSIRTKPFVFHTLSKKDMNLLLTPQTTHKISTLSHNNDDEDNYYFNDNDSNEANSVLLKTKLKKKNDTIYHTRPSYNSQNHPNPIRKQFCQDFQSFSSDQEVESFESHSDDEEVEIVQDPNLTPQLTFFYLWVAILKIIQHQISYQDPLTLKILIPHTDFRDALLHSLHESQQTLYSFIQTLSDHQLLQFVGCTDD